jgi:tetratricopeptide (TPR) repeat protein
MKRRLSHRTILAVSLAALWPVTPALAVAGLQHAALADDSQDDPPLRLAMSYSLAAPPRAPLPDLPQVPVVHAAHPLLDPRDAMARRLRLDVALHADPDPKRAPESAVVADSGDDADVPRAGPPDIVVGMPPPLFLWPARFQTVADRPEPIYLPTAPRPSEEPAPPQLLRSPERMERASAAGHAEPPAAQRPKPARKAQAKKARRAQGARGPVLRGRAWRLANDAYRAYGRGRYAIALQRAEAALKLRPDVARLYLLRVYALQKLQRDSDALNAAEQALAQGIRSPELNAVLATLRQAPVSGPEGTEAYRHAFPIAARAYNEYNESKFAQAALDAEAAVRIDPSQGAWVLLWISALEGDKRFDEAVRAGKEGILLGAPNRDEVNARIRLSQQAIANQYAQKAYDAIAQGKPLEGIGSAREAVKLAPDVESHQLLLITILERAKELEQAEKAATAALEQDNESVAVLLQRAYVRQQLGHSEEAQKDIDTVIGLDWLDDVQRRNARLTGADLALAANQPERAVVLVQPLPANDAQAGARRAYAAYMQKRYGEAIALARQAAQEAPDDEAVQNVYTNALIAGTVSERQEALERLDAALHAKPQDATLLRQRGYLHLADNRPALALQDFVSARTTGQAPPTNVLDEAYATAAMGNRKAAAAMLRQAIDEADAGTLPLDAQQRFDTRSAISSFSREWGASASVGYRGARSASNALVGQPVSVPGNSVFSTAELYWRPPHFLNSSTSTFDVYGRLSSTLHSGADITGPQTVENPCGGTTEVPETSNRGKSGLPSMTGSLGARYTPSTADNLTFGIERQFLMGRAARNGVLNPAPDDLRCQLNTRSSAVNYESSRATGGWQAYMLYGFYDGTALRLDATDWFTAEGYLQAGYTLLDTPVRYAVKDVQGNLLEDGRGRLKRGQGFVTGEVRVGRSFLTPYSERFVVFPHVTLFADWYSVRNRAAGVPVAGYSAFDLTGNGRTWSAGVGPGVNFRYWFEGDRYNAQRSRIDWSIQYRASLGGDTSRARGVFMNLSYSY